MLYSLEDRRSGQRVSENETRDFIQVIANLILTDMKSTEECLLGQNEHIWSKIDRALCNEAWVTHYGSITAQFKDKHALLWSLPILYSSH